MIKEEKLIRFDWTYGKTGILDHFDKDFFILYQKQQGRSEKFEAASSPTKHSNWIMLKRLVCLKAV